MTSAPCLTGILLFGLVLVGWIVILLLFGERSESGEADLRVIDGTDE